MTGDPLVAPADCHTMADLRIQIDRIDAQLVAILAQRATYIDRAAQIKQGVALPARIPARVEEVIANVRRTAAAQGLDPDLAETLWRELIEWSIRREEAVLRPGEQGI